MFSQLKQSALFVLALAVTAPLAGCGYSGEDYCDDRCECEGCSDRDYEECLDHEDDRAREADYRGCADYLDEYLACRGDEGYCRADGRWDDDGCGYINDDYRHCVD
jgi:hypothetical protein